MCAENPQMQLNVLRYSPPTKRDALVSDFTRVSKLLLRVCKTGGHYPSGLEASVVYHPIMDFS